MLTNKTNIGLIDVDGHHGGHGCNFPNLALMKIARFWKNKGVNVQWYEPLQHYDILYMSKVFTFTKDFDLSLSIADVIEKGGTGYDLNKKLPYEIDMLQPDYSIYPYIDKRTAYGFLTRGCPNKCKWCVVPTKEGNIQPYMDVEEIAIENRKNLILMDNNILASDYGLQQIEKIIKLKIRVDFNQALDARLITPEIAKMLAQVKWIRLIRFGCDSHSQISHCENAIKLIRKYGYNGEFFLYCLVNDYRETLERVHYWRGDNKIKIHSQPFRDFSNPKHKIPQWQRDFSRWTNRREIWYTTDWNDFQPRKNFKCKIYNEILK